MNQTTAANTCDQQAIVPALDCESILDIHRDPAGYVSFVRKPDPANPRLDRNGKPYAFENLFSIQAGELRSMFPAIAHWLTHDSYFTINAYYKPAPWLNKTTGLHDVWRKEKYLSKLTACYSDIDCGRPESDEPGAGYTWRQAQHHAELLADNGVIPQPSIVARSGRGAYLFWLLRVAQDPTKLQDAWPEKIELYKKINRALCERLLLNQLPADRAAIDAARVLRVPGSIHRKAQQRVEYVIQLDKDRKGFVYTLPELAQFLNLNAIQGDLPEETRALARPAQYRKTINLGSAPLRSNGLKQLNALRAQDLLTIEQWRGSFLKRGMKYQDGTTSPGRRFILTLYAQFLCGSGAAAVLTALKKMAANMKPAYPSDTSDQDPPLETLINQKRRKWGNAKLCVLLGISADVARDLDLKTIRPADVAHEADQARPLQADMIQERQNCARDYIERHGRISARRLANVYKMAGFKGANPQTANEDLNKLGIIRSPGSRGRPRKNPYPALAANKVGK